MDEATLPPEDRRELPGFLMQNTGAVLNWIAGIVPQVYSAALVPLGIDGRHLAVLLTLLQMGPQVQSRLSQISRIDKATMVSLLNDLETRGSIERRPHPTDKRAYQVHITARGEMLFAQADDATRAATEKLLHILTADEREHLHNMLVRVAEHITPQRYQFGQPLT